MFGLQSVSEAELNPQDREKHRPKQVATATVQSPKAQVKSQARPRVCHRAPAPGLTVDEGLGANLFEKTTGQENRALECLVEQMEKVKDKDLPLVASKGTQACDSS